MEILEEEQRELNALLSLAESNNNQVKDQRNCDDLKYLSDKKGWALLNYHSYHLTSPIKWAFNVS